VPERFRPLTRSPDGWSTLFWSAFNLSANPMVLVQADRVLDDVNDAFLMTFGYTRASARGRRLDCFVAADSRQRMKKDWRELLRTGRLDAEREIRRADGQPVLAQFAAHRELVTGRELVLGVVLDRDRRPMRRGHAAVGSVTGRLTPREREVVTKVALGRRRHQIADELFISDSTVKTHLRNAMQKLDVRSQAHLVAVALANGLIEPEQHPSVEGPGSSRRPHR
jgi:PAS domain S-box-containing protein